MLVLLGTNVLNFSPSRDVVLSSFQKPTFLNSYFCYLSWEMVFKDLIRTSDLQVTEQALLLYDCWCFFFFV